MQPLNAIRREQHVLRIERHARGDGNRLFAGGLHIKGDAPLALGFEHAVVEHPREHHVSQAAAQGVGRQVRIPGAERSMIVVENADQLDGEGFHVPHARGRVGTAYRACG